MVKARTCRTLPRTAGTGRRAAARACLAAMGLLVLSACCDEATREACERDEAARQAAPAPAPAAPAAGAPVQAGAPMRFEITASPGVEIAAAAIESRCEDGKGASAEVRVDWAAATAGVNAVRIKVVEDGAGDKLWTEAGATGQATTGPWVGDGMRLRLESVPGGAVLGEVRAIAEPCT